MPAKVVMAVVAGLLLIALVYVEEKTETTEVLPASYAVGPEALSWLKKNRSESALASNRFLETINAERFVRELYSAGATKVIVPQGSIDNEGEGEFYSDSLVVMLPSDSSKRQRVWQLCRKELEREGLKPPREAEAGPVLLWWD